MKRFAAAVAASMAGAALANPASDAGVAPLALPVVKPEAALKGEALISALKRGGWVLYLRHALQIPPTDEDCSKPALTPEGIAQTQLLRRALSERGIPISRVVSSESCRNRETATRLNLGTVQIDDALNAGSSKDAIPQPQKRRALLRTVPIEGGNTVLVSHVHGGRDKADWMHLDIGEIIVYDPGNPAPVARIRLEDWATLPK
jgi:hypothetical protein